MRALPVLAALMALAGGAEVAVAVLRSSGPWLAAGGVVVAVCGLAVFLRAYPSSGSEKYSGGS